MEGVRRVEGFGFPEIDPETGLLYHVQANNRRIPTAIPAIRFKPLEEVKYKLDNDYVPTYNNYQMVKKGDGEELKVTPITREAIDNDFSWSELREMTRNTVHNVLIPSAGFYYKHADVMPDINIKMVNATPKVMGFKAQERNKGAFDATNMQIMYNTAAKAIDFTPDHFVVPAVDPTFALIGCKNSFKKVIWSEDFDKRENAKGQDLIELIKGLGMTNNMKTRKIQIDYKATSKWTHTVEIIFEFVDELEYMD